MDYQTDQDSSSGKAWYIVAIIVIVALGVWYYYGKQASSVGTESPATAQMPAANTTEDISADLSQIPDVSADLDTDAAAAAQAVQGL